MTRVLYLLITILLFSCRGASVPPFSLYGEQSIMSYAEGFTITDFDGYSVCEVNDPWNPQSLLHRYILVDKDMPLPKELPEGTVIRVPLERVIISTSVHAGVLDMLGVLDKVVGACEPEYMKYEVIQEGIKSGRIAPLGQSTKPNMEQVVMCKADAIIVSPFQNQGYGNLEKVGIPIIECANYMEQTPLGRAEWIKFHAAFFGVRAKADSIFNQETAEYNDLKNLANSVSSRPSILPGKRYGQVWYISAGASYAAHLYSDAGASYPWSDDKSTTALPLSFESVADKAINVDIWIIPYHDPNGTLTLKSLEKEYRPYTIFKPFKKKRVYGCNTAQVPLYENTPFLPSLLLKDMVKIVHPELMDNYQLKYYSIIK